MNENFLTYSIDEKITQYQIGNDLSRPGAIKPEVYEIYVGQPGLRGAKGDVGPQGNPGQAATMSEHQQMLSLTLCLNQEMIM